jgi:hypothetical protein
VTLLYDLLAWGPIAGLGLIGLALLIRPRSHPIISRIGGFVIVAAIVGFVISWNEWWEHDCYDVGEIPGCDVPGTYMSVTWIVSFVACLLAAGIAIGRLIRRSWRHRVSPR